MLFAAPVYALTPPLIHAVRGDFGKGFASLAARVLLPALGFALGASLSGSSRGWPTGPMTVDEGVGLGFGAGAASILDATALGWDRWRSAEDRTTDAVVF
jgi:hypothetical protein